MDKMEGLAEKLLRHRNELFSYSQFLTRDESAAWDLLQDTCMRILSRTGIYDEQGSFVSWAKVVMRHVYYNNLQNSARRCALFPDECDEAHNPLLAVAEESADSTYITAEMNRMIDELPAAHALAFRLYLSGYSYREIAQKMGVSIDNVRNYIHAARAALRKKILQG